MKSNDRSRIAGILPTPGLLMAVFVCLASFPTLGHAQGSGTPTIGGQYVPLPVVPQLPPRPSEGPGEGEQWQLPADHRDDPVASLFEPIDGTDVAIEVIMGQGRLLTTKKPIADEDGTAFIAIGDPTIVDFEVLPNPRLLRITGRRPGVTDLSVTTSDGDTYSFEIHVVYDLRLLSAYLRQQFPNSLIELSQIRDHVVVAGQARDQVQVNQILQTVDGYLTSVQTTSSSGGGQQDASGFRAPPSGGQGQGDAGVAQAEVGSRPGGSAASAPARIINLLRVPGVHQVLLEVKIAELDRTGLREIGSDIFFQNGDTTLGTQLGNALASLAGLDLATNTTAFALFSAGDFQIFFQALRENGVLSVLAEPNLVTLSGHQASFLAGGEFPISVPQGTSGGTSVTVEFKDFGVQLNFVPYVLDDEVIRLTVSPEVSTVDFSLGVTLVPGGDPVPGLNTRRATTTVEMRDGETLAIAGLLSVEMDANTARIPGIGDLPYIGPLFSNTSHERMEKELVVMVTPRLVSPVSCREVGPLPGTEVMDPTDCEFYLQNRIEGRSGIPFRSTTSWDNVQRDLYSIERRSVYGPVGYSECR